MLASQRRSKPFRTERYGSLEFFVFIGLYRVQAWWGFRPDSAVQAMGWDKCERCSRAFGSWCKHGVRAALGILSVWT